MSLKIPGSQSWKKPNYGILKEATGAWAAFNMYGNQVFDLSGNKRHMTNSGSRRLAYNGERYMFLDGEAGNYASINDVNLLDSRQASFDNVGFDGTVNPEDRYEVWGTGGGTAAGAFTDASPFLIDLESYDVAGGLQTTEDDYASTPHSVKFDLTDFSVVGDIQPDVVQNLSAGQTVAVRRTNGQSWHFRLQGSSALALLVYDGVSFTTIQSTAQLGSIYSDGQRFQVRADYLDATSVTFYHRATSADAWVQLGTVVNHSVSINQSISPLEVGDTSTLNGYALNGTVYEVQLRSGAIDGPLVANPKFEGAHMSGGVTSFIDGQSNTWTLNGNASIASATPSQVGWLPGESGNYFSIPDTNLLDADTAHLEQSIGGWATNGGTLASSTTHSLFGNNSLEVTSTVNNHVFLTTSPRADVVAGQQYSATIWVYSDVARDVHNRIDFYDETETRTAIIQGPAVTLVPGQWTEVAVTATAPANSVKANMAPYIVSTLTNEVFYFDRACVRLGSDPTFLPSPRIASDLDISVRFKAPEGLSTYGLVSNYISGVGGFTLYVSPGAVRFHNPESGSFHAISATFPDRGEITLRLTRDATTGTIEAFFDGVSVGTVADTPGNLRTNKGLVSFGRNTIGIADFFGEMLYTEIRDGIDGPVVVSLDLTKQFEGNVTSDTSPEGHIASLNRSGDATAEIVDKDMWAFNAAEWLEFPDKVELDAGDSEIEMASSIRTRSSLSFPSISKRSPAGTRGYETRPFTGLGTLSLYHDGSSAVLTTNAGAVQDGLDHVIGGYRVGNNLFAHVDGASTSGADLSGLGSIDNDDPLTVGARFPGSQFFAGLISWAAFFRRPLTTAERSALAAWDGQVATEPSWLRPLAVFYINANDPWVKDYYDGTLSTNEVLNLATAPYGELGWQVREEVGGPEDGFVTMSTNGTVTPVVGHMVLRHTGFNQAQSIATSEAVGPVTPGLTYSASFSAMSNSSTTHVGLVAELIWLDEEEGEIGRSSGTYTLGPTGNWARSSIEGTAPAGAAKVALEIVGRPQLHNYLDAVVVRQGSDTGYVPSMRIREDIDMRAAIAMDDWTPDTLQYFFGKDGFANGGYYFRVEATGVLQLAWHDGTTFFNSLSTVAPTVVNGEALLVRATLDADNGASGYSVNFYTKPLPPSGVAIDLESDTGWTQLGSTVTTAGVTSIGVNENNLQLGARFSGGVLTGKFYSAVIKDGIGGPTVLDADFTDESKFAVPYIQGSTDTGHTVDLEDRATLVTSTRLYLDGVDDYLSTPHDDAFSVGAADDLTVVYVGRTRDGASGVSQVAVAKRDLLTNSAGWSLSYASTGRVIAEVDDGVDEIQAFTGIGAALEDEVDIISMTLDRSVNELSLYSEGGDSTGVDVSTVDNLTTALPVEIGRSNNSGSGLAFLAAEIFGAAVFVGRVLTDEEIQEVAAVLAHGEQLG